MAIGFFAGASGTYFFDHGFHLPVVALLGIAGLVTGTAITAGLTRSKLDPARRAGSDNRTAQIRARWEYRPRDGIGRHAETQGTQTVDALNVNGPVTHIDDTVWFDFISIESAAKDEPTNSPTPKPYD